MVGQRLGSTSFRLTRLTMTCGTVVTGNGASCTSISKSVWALQPPAELARNSPGPSAALASPSLQIQQHNEIGPALGSSSVPRVEPVSSGRGRGQLFLSSLANSTSANCDFGQFLHVEFLDYIREKKRRKRRQK